MATKPAQLAQATVTDSILQERASDLADGKLAKLAPQPEWETLNTEHGRLFNLTQALIEAA
jgi:hypothetical protein